ncbi:uncharacterized protein LOC116209954 isoform X2 [Punica granatum]|uniref:Uncharacterized protein LOC116209954 isoform X2 n=1 Tax=Punica granatum TaxID=22663 RepID=A0A6P8E279_PUNGR|nr:uncharacterized protein LOC116209954 isoform X2 [Punica granatum]XP_031399581.1 uncharacterized protein LOC116209954 isoform X2 [Punica granatum]XP_031399582.1 uncharacterized protein LOC116209954 isoform X2 [Punica granatum]XP_031399583.1 uncharacterized protein LOC116209954 isoform X2 [Punica granatum]
MTMVEDKETRVRSAGSLSTDYATIVPIKKRRFPIVRPPSPPPDESCPTLESDEKRKESTSASQGSAVLNNTMDEGKLERSAIPQGAGASSASQQGEEASANQKNLESLSVKLALANGESGFDCSNGARKSESEGTDLCMNRSNWDLNTTMDAWEGSASDATSISTESLHDTITATGNRIDIKPLGGPSEISRVNTLGEQTAAERQLREAGAASSAPSANPQTYEDSLKLGLHISFPSNLSRGSPYLSPVTDPNTIFSRLLLASSSCSVAPVTVKSEPLEEAPKQASLGAGLGNSRSLGGQVVKHETVNKGGHEISQKSDYSTLGLFNSRSVSVKPEPACEGLPTTLKTNEETSHRLGQISLGMQNDSCTKVTESVPINCLLANNSISNRPEDGCLDSDLPVTQKASENVEKIATGITEANEAAKHDNVEKSEAKLMNELHSSSKVDVKDCAIDKEKLDVSASVMEDHSDYGYESIGNHPSTAGAEKEIVDREENEYEDGEVQDQLVADGHAEPMNATPVENVNKAEGEPDNMEFAGNSSYQCADSSSQKKEDTEMQHLSEMEDTLLDDKGQVTAGLETHLEDLSDFELDSDTTGLATVAQETIVPPADENLIKDPNIASFSDEATLPGHELSGAFAHDMDADKTENNVSNADAEKNDSILPKAESSVNSDAVGRDSNTESNRSRIINLSTTFNVSSPGKTSSASDRSMPLHDGRKRLPNVALEGDKMHLRGRDEVGNADFHRFSRERNRDMFSRNPRSGFARDRGRVPSNMCADWESEQDFGSEMHDGPVEFRATRYRYNSEYRNYNVAPEDGFVGTGWGGRKLLNDNSPNFHGPHSMRRAHGGRDGPATRGPHMVGRVPRNMSPSRCLGMDDTELVGVRHGFVRRERNIGSFSGKGLHRIHSKSPVRLRSRSPVQWSPRRRSPEGFVRHPEMAPRRSPPIYRRERMGSPDRSCFRGEVMMRRPNSPPYISRPLDDMREMNSGRDHGFSRPMMHSGNSSSRVSLRTRRYDMVNSRERAHGEYFRVPMRGARFHELSGDENTDERRRLNEKRGPVRHFRPPCGSDNKGFTYNSDDSSRTYRLCPEDDSVYHEGRNSRERQLERHPKNEPGDAHKTRKIEDQEGSFRHGVSEEFDDMPRYKRESCRSLGPDIE